MCRHKQSKNANEIVGYDVCVSRLYIECNFGILCLDLYLRDNFKGALISLDKAFPGCSVENIKNIFGSECFWTLET